MDLESTVIDELQTSSPLNKLFAPENMFKSTEVNVLFILQLLKGNILMKLEKKS